MHHQSQAGKHFLFFFFLSCWFPYCLTGTLPYTVTLLPVQNELVSVHMKSIWIHTVPEIRHQLSQGMSFVRKWHARTIWWLLMFFRPWLLAFPCLWKWAPNVVQSSDIGADFRTVQFQLMLFAFGILPECLEKPLTVSLAFVHHHHCPDGTATFSFISYRYVNLIVSMARPKFCNALQHLWYFRNAFWTNLCFS